MGIDLYTEYDLIKIHESFVHPIVSSNGVPHKRTNAENLDATTRNNIQKITEDCKQFATYSGRTKRFTLTVDTATLRFNNNVQFETMFIHCKSVLYLVDL